jgi:Multicopper oxidase
MITFPANGSAVIRFFADVPGVWAYHCHIGWHMDAGLLATFIEAPEELRASGVKIPDGFLNQCQGRERILAQNHSKLYPQASFESDGDSERECAKS